MSEPAKVLAWISPASPWGAETPESPSERATSAALMAGADFFIAIQQAKTVGEVLQIHHLIEEVLASMGAASSAALERADRLCGS